MYTHTYIHTYAYTHFEAFSGGVLGTTKGLQGEVTYTDAEEMAAGQHGAIAMASEVPTCTTSLFGNYL